MKRLALIFTTLTALAVFPAGAEDVERIERGNLVMEGIPAIPATINDRLRQYLNTRSAGFSDWHPDGDGMLIATRFGQVGQLHRVRAPMGAREQVTFYNEPVRSGQYAPATHKGFVFSRDSGGNENYQLYFFDEDTGETRLLTDGTSRNQAAVWSNDGIKVAFQSNKRNGTDWDIYIIDPDDPENARMVFSEKGYWLPVEFSPDDSRLLMINYISITESELAVLDMASGELSRINPGVGPVAYGGAAFTANGTGLYLVTDWQREVRTLRHYDFASGDMSELSADIPWDVQGFDLSPDGEVIAFATNEDGLSRIHLRRTADNTALKGPDLPAGILSGLSFSPDDGRLAFTLNQSRSPSDVYVYTLAGQELVRWTKSEVGGLNADRFVAPELVHYPTFDEVDGETRKIPAFVFKPEGDGPHPVIISIHGGPEGQYRPGYSATYQFWLNELGAAVIAPNVRGSSGYGKTYVALDNGYQREDSVKDIGALLDWIETRPDLDQNRVVVFGGSYGGYMVLASMVHYNDRLLGAVDIVGISNFVTFLENTQSYRRDLRRVEYGDERDPKMRAFLQRIAPFNHADTITRPLFIIQGRNDPRVPYTESEQMLKIVRDNGGDVWYLMAMDEGHGFRKKSNRDFQNAATALFLDRLFSGKGISDETAP